MKRHIKGKEIKPDTSFIRHSLGPFEDSSPLPDKYAARSVSQDIAGHDDFLLRYVVAKKNKILEKYKSLDSKSHEIANLRKRLQEKYARLIKEEQELEKSINEISSKESMIASVMSNDSDMMSDDMKILHQKVMIGRQIAKQLSDLYLKMKPSDKNLEKQEIMQMNENVKDADDLHRQVQERLEKRYHNLIKEKKGKLQEKLRELSENSPGRNVEAGGVPDDKNHLSDDATTAVSENLPDEGVADENPKNSLNDLIEQMLSRTSKIEEMNDAVLAIQEKIADMEKKIDEHKMFSASLLQDTKDLKDHNALTHNVLANISDMKNWISISLNSLNKKMISLEKQLNQNQENYKRFAQEAEELRNRQNLFDYSLRNLELPDDSVKKLMKDIKGIKNKDDPKIREIIEDANIVRKEEKKLSKNLDVLKSEQEDIKDMVDDIDKKIEDQAETIAQESNVESNVDLEYDDSSKAPEFNTLSSGDKGYLTNLRQQRIYTLIEQVKESFAKGDFSRANELFGVIRFYFDKLEDNSPIKNEIFKTIHELKKGVDKKHK